MGILNGSLLLDRFYNGLYKRYYVKSMNLYVDGEFVRFKGLTEGNKTQRNAEEAIATEATKYLNVRILRLSKYLKKSFNNVYIYMDGKRVSNKVTRGYDNDIDTGLIRIMFKKQCECYGYRVVQLNTGEGELQMYLERDRTAELNVFFTKDSDMLSILYGHEARYSDWKYKDLPFNDSMIEKPREIDDLMPSTFQDTQRFDHNIYDHNNVYTSDTIVRDSCVWAVCDSVKKPIQMIGFDRVAERMGISKLVFSTFCSMVGTDFTNSIVTRSMISGFFTSIDDDELKRVNEYTIDNTGSEEGHEEEIQRVFEIVVLIILAGLRAGGTIKQANRRLKSVHIKNVDCLKEINALQLELFTIVKVYNSYISTGIMLSDNIPRIDNPQTYVRTIVHICRDGVEAHYKNQMLTSCIQEWSRTVSLQSCLDNLKLYKSHSKTGTIAPKKLAVRRKLFTDNNGDFEEIRQNQSSPINNNNNNNNTLLVHDYKKDVTQFVKENNINPEVTILLFLF